MPPASFQRRRMEKEGKKSTRWLVILLILLVIALVCVVGYILYRERLYEVSDEYYDSLRSLVNQTKGAWQL